MMTQKSVEHLITKVAEANGFTVESEFAGWCCYLKSDAKEPWNCMAILHVKARFIDHESRRIEAFGDIQKMSTGNSPEVLRKLADELTKIAHTAQVINDMQLVYEVL